MPKEGRIRSMRKMIDHLLKVAPLLVFCVFFSGCLSLYSESAMKQFPSPGGNWIAVLYVGGGGATGGSCTSVNIFSSTEKFPLKSSQGVEKGTVFLMDEIPEMNLIWQATDTLEIVYFAAKEWKVFKQLKEYNGIKIKTKRITTSKPRPYSEIYPKQEAK